MQVDGKCTRCQMICIDQTSGEKSIEPLRTISKKLGGKMTFGIYLSQTQCILNSTLSVNSPVIGYSCKLLK